MKQDLKPLLAKVVNDTLEKLTFMFAFPDEERLTDGPEPVVIGRVDFNGFFNGSMLMRISTSALPELASNMLGLDDEAEITDAEQQDAFKELINVICGNALPALADNQVEFNISAPEIVGQMDAAKPENVDHPPYIVRLTLEEGYCDVYLYVH